MKENFLFRKRAFLVQCLCLWLYGVSVCLYVAVSVSVVCVGGGEIAHRFHSDGKLLQET